MANKHKIFITEEDLKQNRRKELETRAFALWVNSAEEYRSLPFDYFSCLEEKRKRKLKLHKLPMAVEDYPNLELLMFMKRYDMEKFVYGLTMDQLSKVVETTEDALEHNYAICSLREWVRDAKYIIKHYDEEKQRKSSVQPIQSPWPDWGMPRG